MAKLYGSLQNRLEENRQFVDQIKVGTGMTEYSWSDREAYEVVAVKDQKHVSVRRLDHKAVGETMSNDWELISNPENPVCNLEKRGNYWYWTVTLTADELNDIPENDWERRLRLSLAGFDFTKIAEKGKQTVRSRANVSFGVARYYYDYEF